jgi:hypothetical protein
MQMKFQKLHSQKNKWTRLKMHYIGPSIVLMM